MSDDTLLPVLRAAALADAPEAQRWLVARSGRAPRSGSRRRAQCCKSWLALDLAVSVAAGHPASAASLSRIRAR
jgi:hypothetical protein